MQEEMFQPEPATPATPPLSAHERALAWTRRAWRPAATVLAVLLALLLMWHVINGKNGLSVWRQKRA